VPSGKDSDHTAARIGRPQRAVALREDALWPLQIVANELEVGFVVSRNHVLDWVLSRRKLSG